MVHGTSQEVCCISYSVGHQKANPKRILDLLNVERLAYSEKYSSCNEDAIFYNFTSYRNELVYCAIRNSSYFSLATAPGITGKLSQNIVFSFSNDQTRELIPSLFCPQKRNGWWGLRIASKRHISSIEVSEMIIYTQILIAEGTFNST